MKKHFSAFAIAIATSLTVANIFGASRAATEAWVKAYVGGLNGGTNDTVSIDVGGTNGTLKARFEMKTESALMVTNSVLASVTNGTLFAYDAGGSFTNAALGAHIQATASNLVWNAVASMVVDGVDFFPECFGVVGKYLTPTEAKEIKRRD